MPRQNLKLFKKTVRYQKENTKKEIIWLYEVSYIIKFILLATKNNKIKLYKLV
jgi:hypothetical protein